MAIVLKTGCRKIKLANVINKQHMLEQKAYILFMYRENTAMSKYKCLFISLQLFHVKQFVMSMTILALCAETLGNMVVNYIFIILKT